MKTRHEPGSRAPVQWETFVLTRRVGAVAIWRANGILRDRRGAISPVEVELTIGEREGEVVLRPAVRNPHRWGRRRLKRYFAAAHPAIDALKRELEPEGTEQ